MTHQSQQVPSLNTDVLIYIMRFIERKKHLLQMMWTCRCLYDSGLPILCGMTNVPLVRDNQDPRMEPLSLTRMVSFTQFILTNPKARGPLVRGLELDSPWSPDYSYDVLPEFAKTLIELSNLEYLKIYELDRWLQLEPTLAPSLIALRNLRSVNFNQGDLGVSPARHLLQTIEAMASPIRVIDLQFRLLDHTNYNPFLFLRKFSATLEHITVSNANLDNSSVAFPFLKTLVIMSLGEKMISVKHLLNGAPNLKTLYLLPFYRHPSPDDVYTRTRDENIHTQRTTPTWTSLEYIGGALEPLYSLGLQCHVRHVQMVQYLCSRMDVALWHAIAQDTKPTAISILSQIGLLRVDILRTLIPKTVGVNVKQLYVEMDLDGVGDNITVKRFLTNLDAMLRPLPLTYLDLGLEWSPGGEDENEEEEEEEDTEQEDGDTVGYDLEINFEQPYEPGDDANLNLAPNNRASGSTLDLSENDIANPIGSFVHGLITKPNILIERIIRVVPTLRTIILQICTQFPDSEKAFVFDVITLDGKVYVKPSTKDLETVKREERME